MSLKVDQVKQVKAIITWLTKNKSNEISIVHNISYSSTEEVQEVNFLITVQVFLENMKTVFSLIKVVFDFCLLSNST